MTRDTCSLELSTVRIETRKRHAIRVNETQIGVFSVYFQPGTTPKDVMDLLLLTQYFDMLKDVGNSRASNGTTSTAHVRFLLGTRKN